MGALAALARIEALGKPGCSLRPGGDSLRSARPADSPSRLVAPHHWRSP